MSLAACSNKHRFNNFRHVPFLPYNRKDGTTINLRGSFEVRFAQYLDVKNIEWEYAKPINFVDKFGVSRYMLPDFFIPSMLRYFDTKGYLSKECADKIELVREQSGIIIQLLFRKDIEALERGEKELEDF